MSEQKTIREILRMVENSRRNNESDATLAERIFVEIVKCERLARCAPLTVHLNFPTARDIAIELANVKAGL